MSKPLKPWYTVGWLIWALGFIVLETFAIRSKDKGDTLSEHVWWFERWAGSIGRFIIGGGLAWLAYHFLVEIPK